MKITHRTGSYEIVAGTIQEHLSTLPEASYVVTDENVLKVFGHLLPNGAPCLSLPAGESSKTAETYLSAIDWLWKSGAQRGATVVALGGGVIGDLAGFVAATYMRGVRFLQVPTTLLAQVDSSVGGKVGVDLPGGKNMLGAFYPPSEVRLSFDALESLPGRQFTNGLAEVLKYGFIMAPEVLTMGRDRSSLPELVTRCIECKAEVVEEDELETTGRRAILNFGHTVGHALELLLNFDGLLHGEAISVGMVVEARLSELLGMAPSGTAEVVEKELKEAGLPTTHPLTNQPEDLIAAMRRDKKASKGGLAFSLLSSIGNCALVQDVQPDAVRAALIS